MTPSICMHCKRPSAAGQVVYNGLHDGCSSARRLQKLLDLSRAAMTFAGESSRVVTAVSEEEATRVHAQYWRDGVVFDAARDKWMRDGETFDSGTWASHPRHVVATRIGVAVGCKPGEVVCASFNAG